MKIVICEDEPRWQSDMTEAISSLTQTEQDRIYKVVGAMIDFDKVR